MSIMARLERVERLIAHKRRQEAVCVTFADGSERTMPAPDAIPLFCSLDAEQITAVTGGGKGDGRLVELLAGLIGEP